MGRRKVCPSTEEEQRAVLAEVQAAAQAATTEPVLIVRSPLGVLHEETAGGLTACGVAIDYRWVALRPTSAKPPDVVLLPTCAACVRVRERAAAYLAAMAGGAR